MELEKNEKSKKGQGQWIGGVGSKSGAGTKTGVNGAKTTETRGQIVTVRDRLACRWVCEQGLMRVDQLWRAVWWSKESKGPRYAYDRVLFLTRIGFLKEVRSSFSLKSYFQATKLGHELALSFEAEQSGPSLVPRQAPSLYEVGHIDGLTEVRLFITQAGKLGTSSLPYQAPWRTDRMLAIDPTFPKERFFKHVPDAIWLTRSGKRVAIEYERSRKKSIRIRQKVETFTRELLRPDRAFDLVLWIGVPGTMTGLGQALLTHPNQKLRTMEQFFHELKNERNN